MTNALTDKQGWTPGPWKLSGKSTINMDAPGGGWIASVSHFNREANARLIAAAPELVEVLHEGRRAIGDHFAPNDCYTTGPLTGDPIRDLVQCPACSFIAMHDAVLAKIGATS